MMNPHVPSHIRSPRCQEYCLQSHANFSGNNQGLVVVVAKKPFVLYLLLAAKSFYFTESFDWSENVCEAIDVFCERGN